MPESTERKTSKLALLKRAAARKMAARHALAKAGRAAGAAASLSVADRKCAEERDEKHIAALTEAQDELSAATDALAELEKPE